MLQGEHSAILLAFIKPPFAFKTFILSIFEWALKTDFTVYSSFQSVCCHYFAESINFGMKHCADLTKSMGYLLATGNLVSPTGLGLMQV